MQLAFYLMTGLLSQPYNLTWSIISTSNEITFNWDSVVTHCYDFHYAIHAENCGSCPNNTAQTTVSCTGVPTDGTCVFSVHTVFCDHINGNLSEQLHINLIQQGT